MTDLSISYPLNPNPRIGFIGLGNMGSALAMRLLEPSLMVFDPDRNKMKPFTKKGAIGAQNVPDIGKECDIIFACLPTSVETEVVLFGESGLAPVLGPGKVFIDMTSGDPSISHALAARLNKSGVSFVDAPVSGGPRGASEGSIAIMIGTDPQLYEQLFWVFEKISCNIFHAGPVGAGHALKAGNNLLNLICRIASYEVVSLLVNAGVSAEKAVDILQKSSGRNYATEITLPDNILSGKMHQGFSMEMMKKDAELAIGIATAINQEMPLGETAFLLLKEAIETHGSEADMSLVALHFEEKTGARIRP